MLKQARAVRRNPFVVLVLLVASVLLVMASPVAAATPIFQDDFSHPSSGWKPFDSNEATANYRQGGFDFSVKAANWGVIATAPVDPRGDVVVEADATLLSGPQDSAFGLVCRVVDFSNYYYFNISADGRYELVKVVNDESHQLYMTKAQPSWLIEQGAKTNRLRMDCIGDRITVYINDQPVFTAYDSQFTSGEVGFKVETFDQGDANVRFDNFVVSIP